MSNDRTMKTVPDAQPPASPSRTWFIAALAFLVAPALVALWLAELSAAPPLSVTGGPLMAIGLMGAGMIGAASAGRFWIGVLLALVSGAGMILVARALGMTAPPHTLYTLLVLAIAGFSFAARGALFARSARDKGWLVALFVVGGEAAILVTATARPGALPDWLLVLLPAQWASMAIRTALAGTGTAIAPLLALAGTALATLFVFWMWPRRWTYLVMFTTWLGLSALVWQYPGTSPHLPGAPASMTRTG